MALRNIPIRRKLMLIILGTSAVVLLLTCTAFFAYEFLTFRQTAIRQLSTLGQIVATNSTAALAFDNPEDATAVLAALRAEPEVTRAALYKRDGSLFARYPAHLAADAFPRPPENGAYVFTRRSLSGFEPVIQMQGGRRLGTLYLESGLGAMYERFQLYAMIATIVIGLSFLVAYALSRGLQAQVSRPILALTHTARAVAEGRDYSVRATKHGRDEVGLLTDAFNHMLARIQEQMQRLALLSQITRAISERQDLNSIFHVTLQSIEDNLPIDFGCICLYDRGEHRLTVASIGRKSASLASVLGIVKRETIDIDENGLSRCVRGDLVYEPDTADVKFPFPQRLAKGGLHALVAAPLRVESNVFGILIAARRAPHTFSSTDCEFLRQLSEHVALAANQAQVYTALQQAYEELRQTQQAVLQQERLRALGQMASGIAHDINNAISPVSLYTESLLNKEPHLSARAREYLTTIQHSIDDVAQTVSRMREFYRPREPQLALTPVDANRLIERVADLTRARWFDMPQQRGVVIDLKRELATGLPPILGVESEIREALINLVFNAVDAMPDGGTLAMRTRVLTDAAGDGAAEPRRRVAIEVIDTGVGMDAETRRRCLEPFFTTKGERGTGLGLAMVYGTVKRHSAEVEIDSEPGRGTTMRLLFPVPTSALELPVEQGERPWKPSRLRLLIVDDDPVLLKSLRDTLTDDGHDITTANSGQAGIEAFLAAQKAGKPFGAVITDLGMPHIDGRRVASTIKEASPTTPIFLLTGWGQRLAAEGEIPPHIERVLTKPPKLRDLREALGTVPSTGSQPPH